MRKPWDSLSATCPQPFAFLCVYRIRIVKDLIGGERWRIEGNLSVLCKPNILALLPKALSADVEAVFADQTRFVCADAA